MCTVLFNVNFSVFRMENNENCKTCNVKDNLDKLDKDIYKKDGTACKSCYNKQKKKTPKP